MSCRDALIVGFHEAKFPTSAMVLKTVSAGLSICWVNRKTTMIHLQALSLDAQYPWPLTERKMRRSGGRQPQETPHLIRSGVKVTPPAAAP